MRRVAPDVWLTLHCTALAAAIAKADGWRDAMSTSLEMQIFTRGDDCMRDDLHRNYFIATRGKGIAPISE
jgi:hypothetical protein